MKKRHHMIKANWCRQLARNGDVIQAIKELRDANRLPLFEAKEWIENYLRAIGKLGKV